MKKMLLMSLLLLTTSAFAVSSGPLALSGVVVAVNDITITPNANATTLNIINGESAKSVADVSETSNNLTGYSISMRSANASKLVHSVDSSKSTSYKISYDGGLAISLTIADQEVKNVASLAGLTTVSSNVKVDVTPYATAPAGTYSDTITISIAAN